MTSTRTPPDWNAHRRDQQLEDVQFLLDHGATLEAACRRVGVHPDTLAMRITRAAQTHSAEAQESETR